MIFYAFVYRHNNVSMTQINAFRLPRHLCVNLLEIVRSNRSIERVFDADGRLTRETQAIVDTAVRCRNGQIGYAFNVMLIARLILLEELRAARLSADIHNVLVKIDTLDESILWLFEQQERPFFCLTSEESDYNFHCQPAEPNRQSKCQLTITTTSFALPTVRSCSNTRTK